MEGKPIPKSKVAEREEEILQYWQERNIFKKTLEKDAPNGEFVFYDGPPFATGLPHFGNILAGTIKDYMGRYQTMKGKHVARRWGWDCHGLPVENIVEKEIGLKSKKDIEEYGIEKFNDIARTKIFTYVDDWKKIIPRMGRFVDMENDYRTMNPSYTESVWWVFKELHNKGLVYEGFKSMHLCPHCGTTLSNFEVNQGYKDITDISTTVKFKIKNPEKLGYSEDSLIYILAWTTTPWTLPGNVALAICADSNYVMWTTVENGKTESYIASSVWFNKKEVQAVANPVSPSQLIGLEYEPVFGYYNNSELKNRENGFKVYGASFVTTEDGTGIVHIAPAFGEDDMNLGKEKNLPFIQHVGTDGKFKTEVTDFAGAKVKPIENSQLADIEIIKYLAGKGTLFAKEKFIHSYPHCYRCDTPLLNYASSSWFVEVTKFKDRLVEENNKISWVPEEVGDGRFGKWLENARDWAISRSRFWGAPLPVWKCDSCPEKVFIGSVDELKQKTTRKNKYLVVRHGEAESNVLKILSSNPKTKHHLTEKGKDQAQVAGENLSGKKIDVIYCSPFMRTKETAEIIAEKVGFPVKDIKFDERLHEIFAGEMDGHPDAEYQAFFFNRNEKFLKAPKGGENHTMVKNRMTQCLYDIDAENEGKNILIVSHNTPIWLMFAGAAGLTPEGAIAIRTKEAFVENSEIKELSFAPIPHNRNYELDMHRPFIDEVHFNCVCGGTMKRIPEVFDCWFESGAMPYAEGHYPFENSDKFNPKNGTGFPADFIAEGLDQTRGWFYVMLIIGTALFGKSPYKNVIVNGMVLAEDGKKMSKHLKNYTDPMELVDTYSADAVRYYMLSSPAMKSEDLKFSNRGVDEILKKIIMRLQNVYSFFEMYGGFDVEVKENNSKNILDQWILIRLKELETQITKATDKYELDRATRPFADFVDDISTWFLRRSRDRFKSEDVEDRYSAMLTTRTVILELSKLMAPAMPFTAEDLYLKITGGMEKESVHLESWPHAYVGGLTALEEKVLENMKETRALVTLALEARSKAGIKARQPLGSLKIKNQKSKLTTAYTDLIKEEVNVKEVIFDESIEDTVELDTEITEDLKEEGTMRDIIRAIQEMRKSKNLKPADVIDLVVDTDVVGKKIFEKFNVEISKVTGVKDISFEKMEGGELIELDGFMARLLID